MVVAQRTDTLGALTSGPSEDSIRDLLVVGYLIVRDNVSVRGQSLLLLSVLLYIHFRSGP